MFNEYKDTLPRKDTGTMGQAGSNHKAVPLCNYRQVL